MVERSSAPAPGQICLDFNNTIRWRSDGSREEERFVSDRDVLAWAGEVGVMPAEVGRAAAEPGLAGRARELREHLHRLLAPLASWHAPAPEDLETFNRYLSRAAARLSLARGRGRFDWDFSRQASSIDSVLAEVIWSAAWLLTSPDLRRLRGCADPDCGRLFLDRSRRGNRRWCAMKECGSRAKARRYYARRRAAGAVSPRP
jgi:predicted RNA-binding Zn ribbon-like protein